MATTVKLFDVMDLNFEWLDYLTEHPLATWPSLTYTDDNNTSVTVIDGDIFWDYITEHYPDFYYFDRVAILSAKGNFIYTQNAAMLSFMYVWGSFLTEHPEYARLAKMLDRTDYDPLENYDRKEDGGWKDTEDDDAIHKMQYAEVQTTTTNDPKIKTKTTGSVYGDNSSVAVPQTMSVTEPERAAATDVDTIKTTTPLHTDQSSVEGDKVMTRLFQNYRVHGNVGVTTAAQMIEGEIKVRERYNIITRCLESFVKQFLTLREEVTK